MATASCEDASKGIQSLVYSTRSLCWQLLQQLWLDRLVLPLTLGGAVDESKMKVENVRKSNARPESISRCKTLERFYSARDLFESEAAETADRYLPDLESTEESFEFGASNGEEEEIRRVFDTLDEDGNGRICREELARFMRKLNIADCSDLQIDTLLQWADEDRNGFLEFSEFLKVYPTLHQQVEESSSSEGQAEDNMALRDAFDVFDKNQDGFISLDELLAIVKSLELKKKRSECARMIKAVDKDGDGKVNFEEFKQLMLTDFQQ